jgi:hypothetical protein
MTPYYAILNNSLVNRMHAVYSERCLGHLNAV